MFELFLYSSFILAACSHRAVSQQATFSRCFPFIDPYLVIRVHIHTRGAGNLSERNLWTGLRFNFLMIPSRSFCLWKWSSILWSAKGAKKKRQINCRSHHPAFVNLQRKQVSAFSCNQRGHKKMLMISISGHGCWPLDLVMKAIKDQSPEKKNLRLNFTALQLVEE